jgi:hypothetical protein
MATKMNSKDRRALLQGMKTLKESGEALRVTSTQRSVLDQRTAYAQRKFAQRSQPRWCYQPTDLVRCKHWQWGEFNATVIRVQGTNAHLLGPMGAVTVPCQSLRLIDRFEDPCEESGA